MIYNLTLSHNHRIEVLERFNSSFPSEKQDLVDLHSKVFRKTAIFTQIIFYWRQGLGWHM